MYVLIDHSLGPERQRNIYLACSWPGTTDGPLSLAENDPRMQE